MPGVLCGICICTPGLSVYGGVCIAAAFFSWDMVAVEKGFKWTEEKMWKEVKASEEHRRIRDDTG
jgi:hypothetical protein